MGYVVELGKGCKEGDTEIDKDDKEDDGKENDKVDYYTFLDLYTL